MKNSRFFVLFIFSVVFLFAFGIIFAQTKHTLEDYGLSADAVKYLSPQEIQIILNSKTPAETIADKKTQIEQSGTPEQKAGIYATPQPVNAGVPAGAVDCFNYYHFGSVQTALTAQSFNFNPGDSIQFNGPITNQNDYPIVDGMLYIKIFRQRSLTKDSNGPDVVDQFVASDNITIPAKGRAAVSFLWKGPASLTVGNYEIASFFIVNKKFNLLGLSFTDDVIGNTFSFKINGDKSNVQFDKTGVTINNTPYFFAAYPPDVPSKNPAVISAKINNTTSTNQTVGIVWKLYSWDSIDPVNLIRTVSAQATIKSNSSTNVQLAIPEASEPVYYVVGELDYKDSKSIIDVRFVRPEVDKLRINFPSIISFPIKSGATSTMFSCVYNSGTSQSVQNGKLTLTLADSSGKTINEYTYKGPVTGNMMAVKNDFVSKNNLDHFFLTAQLWQSDKLVAKSTLEYDCNKIDPKLCNKKNNWLAVAILVIIVLLAIYGAFIIFLKRKNNN